MDGPQLILDLIEAFRRSKVMFAAARLGVFDLLTGGTASAEALAAHLNCCPESFAQLLDACVALGLVEKNAGGAYRNAPAADRYLRRSSPDSLLGYVLYSDSALYPLWGPWKMLSAREGIAGSRFSAGRTISSPISTALKQACANSSRGCTDSAC